MKSLATKEKSRAWNRLTTVLLTLRDSIGLLLILGLGLWMVVLLGYITEQAR